MSVKSKIPNLLIVNKVRLADRLLAFAITLAFYASLYPWFLWPLAAYYVVPSALLSVFAFTLYKSSSRTSLTRTSFIVPLGCFTLLATAMFLVNDGTFGAFVALLCNMCTYYALFRLSPEVFNKIMLFIVKTFAILILISATFFLLYLTGRNLPNSSAVYGDNLYSFSNYYFFLLADADIWTLIPRFQSVFLEPSHMAVAADLLLMTQCGKWGKWYNVILLGAVCISFSLEAYVLLFCLVFFNKWIQGKRFIRNLLIIIVSTIMVVVGSFFYNDGENMINQLIVLRLEVDDGEMAGNNRTTEGFDAEYESFLNSSDILVGREMDGSFGNSGYKVFLYENGLICTILLFAFYVAMLYKPANKRAAITAAIIALIHFIVRAHMMWASCIIAICYMSVFSFEEEKDCLK